jgi:alpha-1,3-mannosyltransferase
MISLYSLEKKESWIALILLTFSKRIHSIYMLRLFNDCIAVLFGYISILLFTKYHYRLGCLLYSISVSIKMNMLLYSPGILLVLLMGNGFKETIICLSICAITQLVLGYPFLSTYPLGNFYIT